MREVLRMTLGARSARTGNPGAVFDWITQLVSGNPWTYVIVAAVAALGVEVARRVARRRGHDLVEGRG